MRPKYTHINILICLLRKCRGSREKESSRKNIDNNSYLEYDNLYSMQKLDNPLLCTNLSYAAKIDLQSDKEANITNIVDDDDKEMQLTLALLDEIFDEDNTFEQRTPQDQKKFRQILKSLQEIEEKIINDKTYFAEPTVNELSLTNRKQSCEKLNNIKAQIQSNELMFSSGVKIANKSHLPTINKFQFSTITFEDSDQINDCKRSNLGDIDVTGYNPLQSRKRNNNASTYKYNKPDKLQKLDRKERNIQVNSERRRLFNNKVNCNLRFVLDRKIEINNIPMKTKKPNFSDICSKYENEEFHENFSKRLLLCENFFAEYEASSNDFIKENFKVILEKFLDIFYLKEQRKNQSIIFEYFQSDIKFLFLIIPDIYWYLEDIKKAYYEESWKKVSEFHKIHDETFGTIICKFKEFRDNVEKTISYFYCKLKKKSKYNLNILYVKSLCKGIIDKYIVVREYLNFIYKITVNQNKYILYKAYVNDLYHTVRYDSRCNHYFLEKLLQIAFCREDLLANSRVEKYVFRQCKYDLLKILEKNNLYEILNTSSSFSASEHVYSTFFNQQYKEEIKIGFDEVKGEDIMETVVKTHEFFYKGKKTVDIVIDNRLEKDKSKIKLSNLCYERLIEELFCDNQ